MPSPTPSADRLPGYPAADRWRRVPRTGQHYVDTGTGPPVLLLHGNPSWSYQWRHLIAALSPDFRCVAPDLAGLGLSPRPRVPASAVDRHLLQLDHLDALFDHLVAGRGAPRNGWTLVLHDWGGPLGWAWARRRSLRPARIVVLNSICFPWPSGYRLPVYLRWIRDHRGVAALAHATNFFPRAAVRGGVVAPLDRAERRAYLLPLARGGDRRAVVDFVRSIPRDDREEAWRLLEPAAHRHGDDAPGEGGAGGVPGAGGTGRAGGAPGDGGDSGAIGGRTGGGVDLSALPLFVGWGMRDPVFTPLVLGEWERRFPHARVHRYPDAGHYVMEDAADRLGRDVRGFLTSPERS
ncbi:alpha/beta fold hydrolase [Streptomyces sp. NPDC057245]|uniref:alpha/beta fold hydrolase n=1 Tax=Streptomyces sp. NPDC057245 TaxID=3346065 RepID=UPI003635C7CC